MKYGDAVNRLFDFFDHIKFHFLLVAIFSGLLGLGYWAVVHGHQDFGQECTRKAWEVLAGLMLLITGRGATGAFNGNGNGKPPDPQHAPPATPAAPK